MKRINTGLFLGGWYAYSFLVLPIGMIIFPALSAFGVAKELSGLKRKDEQDNVVIERLI